MSTVVTERSEAVREQAKAILPPTLFAKLDTYADRLDLGMISRAYEFSKAAHTGQMRHSGEDFIVHCQEVTEILAELHLDSVTLTCALIHDVVEDTDTTLADVGKEFGTEVARVPAAELSVRGLAGVRMPHEVSLVVRGFRAEPGAPR